MSPVGTTDNQSDKTRTLMHCKRAATLTGRLGFFRATTEIVRGKFH